MSPDTLTHVINSAIVGIVLVFAFLALLGVLVRILKQLTEAPEQRDSDRSSSGRKSVGTPEAAAGAGSGGQRPATGRTAVEGASEIVEIGTAHPPEWVCAAVAAFLVWEEIDPPRSANAWTPDTRAPISQPEVFPARPDRPGHETNA